MIIPASTPPKAPQEPEPPRSRWQILCEKKRYPDVKGQLTAEEQAEIEELQAERIAHVEALKAKREGKKAD